MITKIVLSASAVLVVFSSVAVLDANAATKKKPPQQIICSKDGALLVRAGKCRRGEARLNVSQLVQQSAAGIATVPGPQGLTGPKGDVGPTGPQGDPAGFDVTACYFKQTTTGPLSAVSANASSARSLSCNNTSTEFMLTSSFIVSPVTSANNKPFVQGKNFDLDASGKYPVGVTYYFIQAGTNNVNDYATFVQAICCPK